MNSLHLQGIKLYDKLNIKLFVNHIQKVCSTRSLTDEEMFMLNKSFSLRSSLYETEESTLYYIFAYVAFKQNIAS